MENRVITIARSYGSGGRKMGRLLAKELGYEYYDREILRIASDESGISEELFNRWMRDSISRCSALRARLIPER